MEKKDALVTGVKGRKKGTGMIGRYKVSFPSQNKKKYLVILLHKSEEFILTYSRGTKILLSD
jgi:hypothetical protein